MLWSDSLKQGDDNVMCIDATVVVITMYSEDNSAVADANLDTRMLCCDAGRCRCGLAGSWKLLAV